MSQGTGTPKVTARVASGNLLRQIQVTDGVAGIVGTAYQTDNIGKVKTVYSLDDAIAKGYTESAEPSLYRHISEYYQELGGNMELWILGTEDTMTLESAVSSSNANGLKKLLTTSQGRVNIVGVCRTPASSYSAPAGFLDNDVEKAVIASKSLAQYQQSINRPVRILIEGRIVDATKNPYYSPNTATNTYSGVVIGSTKNDGAGMVGVALARAVKYPAHVKIGNGQNGALSITSAFIGSKPIEDFTPTELDGFSNAGYILPHIRDGFAGYFFGVDNMAGNDDFRILAYGRLIDKAQRIATAANSAFLETSVRMTKDGKLNETDTAYLEDIIKQQIRSKMSEQISDVDVIVPKDQDLINTSSLAMQVKIQPLGYLTWITVNLGLTKNI
ncbi:hypothetical protein FO675_06235 [Riemerella anatipestifer]|uniref:DUF2586 family protein n=1 Tax=Riemerella anatipestifer TaxID=34085 RepID=UPI001AD605D0|nr:DUF2586 family protein [Riemerella anatipestifer]MBO4233901.1 hypothetical protein [Riemerella anatipestifer]